MKVIVFSAIQNNGGIQQFSLQVLRTCIDKGWDAYGFIPDYESIIIPVDLSSRIIRYKKQKDIMGIMPEMFKVAHCINKLNPDFMFVTDDCMYSVQIMRWVRHRIKKIFTVHDVTFHPGRKETILRRILNFISAKLYRREGFFHASTILVLSENSKKRFQKLYPRFFNKIKVMNLGAHPPKCNAIRPKEIVDNKPYLLYFGRIEKYKGIINIIKAVKNTNLKTIKLIIAGNGTFTEDEQQELKNSTSITVINRYIHDGEMTWLMNNSLAIVAPYIEASQSGVLPIAYHFGKPVIVSNIDGLREMVLDGKTGYIFNDINQLTKIVKNFDIDGERISSNLSDACYMFEEEYLNWNKNISKILL